MINSFCPEPEGAAADAAGKTGSHYSQNAAGELLNAITGCLGKSVHLTANFTNGNPWQKELTREERKMEHRVSEQKSGFATLEQLEAWGFHSDAIAECLTTHQRRMLMLPLKPASVADGRLGGMTNRI
jgi:hypothetical protein